VSVRAIWKYAVPAIDRFTIDMPEGGEVLTVQVQRGDVNLWARVDPKATKVQREFFVVGTGHERDDIHGDCTRYVGTFQLQGGALVFHLFEVHLFEELPF
jgi:hypothetical protein